ncbi:MAG TPA: ribosome biogenesis GTPase Der [Gemmatimonadaceae bacterium]|jgi:GTP-binding protein|nr:ribosome biogenesis GTPase Der [Gemmatimonadaceae bacterium]
MNIPVVALIGRPNVGKSALFNRLAGGDAAIVTSQAGTTRDRNFARADWNGRAFWLVDTGGLTDDPNVPMDVEIRRQVMQAIAEADVLMFVVDAQAGIHPQDQRVLEILRESGKPWIVAANKVDDPRAADYFEFYNLGATEVHPVSAKNGKGSGDLLDALVERFPEGVPEESDDLRVAVVGRPNVGKSSIVNRLLGEERLVVSETAGTTRDAIDTPMQYHGRTLVFIDTAGLRRQSKVDEGIEFYSTLRTRRAIERADVCVLVIDATEGLENQDLKIASMAWERGAGLILVVNKWDLVEKGDKTADEFRKKSGEKAPFLRYVPFLFTSALTGQRVSKLLESIVAVQGERERRIATARVNERLGELVARLQPPQAAGHEVKLNYAAQVEVKPPTFAIFGNHPELLAENYLRYLQNGFRESWGFIGSPLRIVLRRKAA